MTILKSVLSIAIAATFALVAFESASADSRDRRGPPQRIQKVHKQKQQKEEFVPGVYERVSEDPNGAEAAEQGKVYHKRTVGNNPAPGFEMVAGQPGEKTCAWLPDNRTLRCANSYRRKADGPSNGK
ncbi:MAG TPA: hypothetical protein VJH91_03415 [Candidatus Paceibacterota bacterium]